MKKGLFIAMHCFTFLFHSITSSLPLTLLITSLSLSLTSHPLPFFHFCYLFDRSYHFLRVTFPNTSVKIRQFLFICAPST